MGIGETLRWTLVKLVMRAAGDQARAACGNLQLCSGLDISIEGATHAVGKRQWERAGGSMIEEEAGRSEEEEEKDYEATKEGLTLKTGGTEEETA